MQYETALKSDKFLVIGHGTSNEVAKAKRIIETTGAAQIAAHPGTGKLRFNSDWQGYSDNFEGHWSSNVVTEPSECDVFPCRSALYIGPYSVLIFSQ